MRADCIQKILIQTQKHREREKHRSAHCEVRWSIKPKLYITAPLWFPDHLHDLIKPSICSACVITLIHTDLHLLTASYTAAVISSHDPHEAKAEGQVYREMLIKWFKEHSDQCNLALSTASGACQLLQRKLKNSKAFKW